MSAIQQLLTDHIDIWTAADTAKKSGRGRSSGNAASVYGIKKLRELILELAVRYLPWFCRLAAGSFCPICTILKWGASAFNLLGAVWL